MRSLTAIITAVLATMFVFSRVSTPLAKECEARLTYNTEIFAPSAAVSGEFRAFSGIWKSSRRGLCEYIAVEEMTPDGRVVVSVGWHLYKGNKLGSMRFTGVIRDDGCLYLDIDDAKQRFGYCREHAHETIKRNGFFLYPMNQIDTDISTMLTDSPDCDPPIPEYELTYAKEGTWAVSYNWLIGRWDSLLQYGLCRVLVITHVDTDTFAAPSIVSWSRVGKATKRGYRQYRRSWIDVDFNISTSKTRIVGKAITPHFMQVTWLRKAKNTKTIHVYKKRAVSQ